MIMKFYILSVDQNNITSKLFDKLGIEYDYIACECQKDRFTCDNVVYYKCKGEHGSNIARKFALSLPDSVVFDDDYSAIIYGGLADTDIKTRRYETKEQIIAVLCAIKALEDNFDQLIVGGYSGGSISGAENKVKRNIMQIFFGGKINRFFRDESDLYRLNDDVCACIRAYNRGFVCMGMYELMRVVQTPELEDNTNDYDMRSWSKSFLPVLYNPTACRVVWVPAKKLANGKIRKGRFHHSINWTKIAPKVVERRDNGQ